MENIIWNLSTDENDIKNPTVEDIENTLALIKTYEIEYMLLKPSEKILNCHFMQSILDENDMFTLEVSLDFEYGSGSMIYSKTGLELEEAREILEGFMGESIIPAVEDWEIVGRFE